MASMRRLDHGAGHGPAAERRAEVSSLSDAVIGGVSSSARHGKPLPERLGRGDHVRHHAVVVGRERRARAADAALHFVEDQHRAGFVAALAKRGEELLAHVERAAHALHRLDDDGGRVLGDVSANRATLPRGMKLTSNGARGKKYHFCGAPQVAPAAGRAAMETPSTAHDLRPGRILNASLKAFSLASAPELIKNTLSNGSLRESQQLLAARARTSIGTAFVWKFSAACSSAPGSSRVP